MIGIFRNYSKSRILFLLLIISGFTAGNVIGASPVFQDQGFFGGYCGNVQDRTIQVVATDPENDPLTYELISGPGSINSSTGLITYTPGSAGTYLFHVSVSDGTNLVQAYMTDQLSDNRPPVVSGMNDSLYYQCAPGWIYVPVTISDPDSNIVGITNNLGYLNLTTSTLQFVSYDTGYYEVIITATDECGEVSADTANIYIQTDFQIDFEVPNDTTVFVCETGTYYFPITLENVPPGSDTTITGINTWYDPDLKAIAFSSSCGITNPISITVATPCGTYEKNFTVTILCNQPPLVALPANYSLAACIGGQVCVPVGISDYDNNIVDVQTDLANGFVYNPKFNYICFTVDTLGTYTVQVSVIDECGEISTDFVDVTIFANTAPVLSYTPSTTYFRQCVFEEICLPVDVSDIDNNLVSVTGTVGYYNYVSGQYCFTPDTAGDYSIIVVAEDECGETDQVLIELTVEQGDYVTVNVSDSLAHLCGPDNICLPVSITGIYQTINTNFGTYDNGFICFPADTAGLYTIEITAVAECNTSVSTATVDVHMDDRITCPPSTDLLLLCEADTLVFDYQISPLVDSVKVSSPAYLVGNQVMVPVLSPGVQTITMTAFSVCGEDVCSFDVSTEFNSSPIITAGADFEVRQCDLAEICLDPISYSDPDNNIDSIVSTHGLINNDVICFTPDSYGIHEIIVSVYDACMEVDRDTVFVTVTEGNSITAQVSDSVVNLCQPDIICLPLNLTGIYDELIINYGTYSNGEVCFDADTAGTYNIEITANAECNSVTVNATVVVTIDDRIVCPGDVGPLFLCGPDTLAFDYQTSMLVDSVKVTEPAYLMDGKVYVPVLAQGSMEISMTAYSVCGIEQCSFNIMTDFNSSPFISMGDDISISECGLIQKSFSFNLYDNDNNITSVVASPNVDSIVGTQYFFTPDDYGLHTIILTVTDACNEIYSDTLIIDYKLGGFAAINCPQTIVYDTICGPDTVYIENFVVEPDYAIVTVDNGVYDAASQTLALYIIEEGLRSVEVVALTQCQTDTCSFDLDIHIPVKPLVVCAPPIDTLVCIDTLGTICVPITITGTDLDISISPLGVYNGNEICFPVDTAGFYEIQIIADNQCGADTCYVVVNVIDDQAPILSLPADTTIIWCPQDTTLKCFDGIFSTDTRSQSFITMTCGDGTLELTDADTGQVCFRPDTVGNYEFCFESTDGCKTISKSFFVNVVDKGDCDVCVRLTIDGGECDGVGVAHNVSLKIESNDYITSFNIMIEYDKTVMSFQSADTTNSDIAGWEYFSFRLGEESCGNACPSGLVQFLGIAGLGDGEIIPPNVSLKPQDVLIDISFRIANDQNLSNQFLPIKFFTYACNNNTFTSLNGDVTYFNNKIYNAEGILIWDEEDDINFPELSRPFGMGGSNGCLNNSTLPNPERCIEYYNGGICILPLEEYSSRGDVNLNRVPYEIADAVVFSNYFIRGLAVFVVDPVGQVAATDVNADGLTLTIADLVLLIRIIVGDALPIPKVIPNEENLAITDVVEKGVKTVTTDAASSIGGALFKFDLIGDVDIQQPRVAEGAEGMQLLHNVVDDQLLVILFDIGNNRIDAGKNDIFEIPFNGSGSIEFVEVEIVDYQGRPFDAVFKGTSLPTAFELHQNYPNPFNPITNIDFALPKPSDWSITVYNINGALVRKFDGSADAGVVSIQWDGTNSTGSQVASGVYLYRLKTDNFSKTKKMLLLK